MTLKPRITPDQIAWPREIRFDMVGTLPHPDDVQRPGLTALMMKDGKRYRVHFVKQITYQREKIVEATWQCTTYDLL